METICSISSPGSSLLLSMVFIKTFAQALMNSGRVERMSKTMIEPTKTMTTDAGSMNAPRPAAEFIAQAINPVPTRPITVAISIIST